MSSAPRLCIAMALELRRIAHPRAHPSVARSLEALARRLIGRDQPEEAHRLADRMRGDPARVIGGGSLAHRRHDGPTRRVPRHDGALRRGGDDAA